MGFLRAAITDPDHRAFVAESLGKLGCREATPEIARLLDANDARARMAAVRALGWLRAVELVPRLSEVAAKDPSYNVRSWALAALGEIGDPTSLPVLLRQLESPDRAVRAGAAIGLGYLGNTSALPALESAKRRDRWRGRPYRAAISRIRRERSDDLPDRA